MNHADVIMYLRKSRADSPAETVEEVLAKHEVLLQDLAEKKLGGRIAESQIFREVVSGETIDERPELLDVMSLIEAPEVKAVLVVEPQRLTRGDLEDCGRLVNAFRYSGTKVLTLQAEYDLSEKMQRKFFEQELVRGNDFLEYTKEILLRGRILSVQKGNFIGGAPPLGYDKVFIDGSPTLRPNQDADVVKMIFKMYAEEGLSPARIAARLDALGIEPLHGGKWAQGTIVNVLKNEHYIGKVFFGKRKTEKTYQNGCLTVRRSCVNRSEAAIVAPGRHEPLISAELFEAAQARFFSNPRTRKDWTLKNPMAGLLFCAHCGSPMRRQPYKESRSRFSCTSEDCKGKTVPVNDLMTVLADVLESECLPELKTRLTQKQADSSAIQKKSIDRLTAELNELKQQEAKQYDLLERGVYSESVFLARHEAVASRIEAVREKILQIKKVTPRVIDYNEKSIALSEAISSVRDAAMPADEVNRLLKAIIRRVEYRFIARPGRAKTVFELDVFLLL